MEISPIPGLRALSAVKPRPSDPELSARFDIEALARPGDDAPAPRHKAAGAEEEDREEDDLVLDSGEDASTATPPTRVSFFA